MRKIITLATHEREMLIDITEEVTAVRESGVRDSIVSVYAKARRRR